MPRPGSSTLRCPLCDRPIDPAIHRLTRRRPVPHLVRILRRRLPADDPDWDPDDGACPDCIFDAARQAEDERSVYSLHEELLTPFPVYSRDEPADLLATPERVHARPDFTGRGVTMALLDSGFYPHPDLTRPANRILGYVDATTAAFEEKQSFKRPHVTSWHGLMTSSVGAGNGFLSNQRYRGIATGASLVLVKTGNRRSRRVTERDIQRALNWVIAHQGRFDIRVVNISLGGDHPCTGEWSALDRKVEDVVKQGMVVVAAAGNSGERRLVPPASAPSALTVGGLDDQNTLDRRFRRMYHSSYGPGVGGVCKPELIAPAMWLAAPMLPRTAQHNEGQFLWKLLRASDADLRRILDTPYAQTRISRQTMSLPPDELRKVIRRRLIEQKFIHPHYQHVDGTSMAAPIVSAVVAQMLEVDPSLTPAQVKQHLIDTAEPLPDVPAERQGHGVVHAGRAVTSVLRARYGDGAAVPLVRKRSVAFRYYDPRARQVALVGSFNGWMPDQGALVLHAPGVWAITISRPPRGTHAYKFLIDGERWAADPENADRIEDGYGGFNSILTVK